jgi:hypothetical protein
LPALGADIVRRERRRAVRPLMWAGVMATGFVVYLGVNWAIYGHPFEFLVAERVRWQQQGVPPWVPVMHQWHALLAHRHVTGFWIATVPAQLVTVVVVTAALVWGWPRMRWSDRIFAWGAFVMSLSVSKLISLPRYALELFPLVVLLARVTESRRVMAVVLTVGIGLQAVLMWRFSQFLWAY